MVPAQGKAGWDLGRGNGHEEEPPKVYLGNLNFYVVIFFFFLTHHEYVTVSLQVYKFDEIFKNVILALLSLRSNFMCKYQYDLHIVQASARMLYIQLHLFCST